MNFDYPAGATPIDPDEAQGLLLPHIRTREELDRWEQENISEAEDAVLRRKQKDILTEKYARDLHKRMFGNVWRWAGDFRRSQKNIGIEWMQVPVALRQLFQEVNGWLEYQSYPPDEIAARFHHRLVAIHAFANGNGRHARLMADVLLVHLLGQKRFSWGQENLTNAGECRRRYIEALQAADRHDYGPLLVFVRS
ncbi:toxin, Fic family [Desulfuromonas sp. DDH964]|uniref:mobile mystery protein B n=1 Tax=Desulfuromonas sp. DDH964 TaxID=1823759 RepID=UPI00078E29CD|nr:mobile mystery protein B [Desulfuromonas sp. DDH964]AMV71526.1 toxin, Fic family [Desulfuromonas sp. DDH964]